MEIQRVKIEQLKLNEVSHLIVDVRSPSEFAEFHLPNAINIPIFTNEERAKIGRVYKQIGEEEAKELGLEIFAPKLPTIYKHIKQMLVKSKKENVLIYCARGGMRSRSVVQTMAMLGLPCIQLIGGIRAFRLHIVDKLNAHAKEVKPFVVLNGLTGSRKTDILHELARQGYPVLDLEHLAGHRGSIFGQIGMKPNSQKTFEMLLVKELDRLNNADFIIIEGESKRIGKVIVPDFILQGKKYGHKILISYPFEKRVKSIYETYHPSKYRERINEALKHLEKRLSMALRKEINKALVENDYKKIYALLLKDYYDKRYNYQLTKLEPQQEIVSFETLNDGVDKIKAILDHNQQQTS